jgi:hypothetical protein
MLFNIWWKENYIPIKHLQFPMYKKILKKLFKIGLIGTYLNFQLLFEHTIALWEQIYKI